MIFTQSVIEQNHNQVSNPLEIAYATQVKLKDMNRVQCYSYQEFGIALSHVRANFVTTIRSLDMYLLTSNIEHLKHYILSTQL